MPRKSREWYPGAIYHVMSRGNRKLSLYQDDEDYLAFLHSIKRTAKLYPFTVHSICLMTNHFHMIIETKDQELWKIMQRILHPYAMNFNRKYNFTGHLFEKRYRAKIIEDDGYLLEVSRYIHLNPVKAQMVQTPIEYGYSSYAKYAGDDTETKNRGILLLNELVDTTRILSYFNDNSEEGYRRFVESEISYSEQEQQIRNEMDEDDMWIPV